MNSIRLDHGADRRLRLLSLFMTIVVALAASAIGYGMYRSWQNAIERETRLLRNTTSSLVATIDRRLETVAGGLALASAAATRLAPDAKENASGLSEALARLRVVYSRIDAIVVTEASGRTVSASTAGDADNEAIDRLTAAAAARHAAYPSDTLLLTPATGFGKDNPNVFIASRAHRGADGPAAGIALATIQMDDLLGTVADMLARDGGRVTILNNDFRVIARLPRAALGADLTNTPISIAIRNGPSAAVIRANSTIDGKKLLTSYAGSAHFPYYIVMSRDLPTIVALWRDEHAVEIAVYAMLFVGFLLSNGWLYRAMRRQMQAEQAMRDSDRARYHRALEGTRDGLAIWSANGDLISWNTRFAEIAALIGKTPRVDEKASSFFTDISARGGSNWDGGMRAFSDATGLAEAIDLPCGTTIEAAHQRDADGDTVTTLRDVTAERAAQRRIGESEARFRDGIESMAEGFILWDRDDRMVAWNSRAETLLPVQAPKFQAGRSFDEILSYLASFPTGNMPTRAEWLADLEHRRRRRDRLGQVSTFVTSVKNVVESVDRSTADGGIVSIYRDVTEQRQLLDKLQAGEQDLRRALAAERDMNEQQRRFVAMASHEFRTPLAVIDGAAQRIQAKGLPPDSDAERRLGRIRASVSKMTEIIDRMLATARLDEGRIDYEPVVFDIVALARDVARRQQSITPDVEIALAPAAEQITLHGDLKLVDHVLTNLLSNAVKYSRGKSKVELRMGLTADHAVIEVEDRGIGIPADEIDKLFTRFFRSRLAAGIAGTGIGLHLVREFVAMHGGDVAVRSEVGHGSTFIVRFPRPTALAAVA